MTGYSRAGFRVRAFGLHHLRHEPGTIIAASHRSDSDVPVLSSVLYPHWSAGVQQGTDWPTFAATPDLFQRGFLAGYPPKLPVALRRLLWPIRVGGPLEGKLQCIPVREPTRMLLVEMLRGAPDEPLDGRLPAGLKAALHERAAQQGRPAPERARDVLHGAYADLLWTMIDRDGIPETKEIWRAHLRAAVHDFGDLAEAIRRGGTVVIFPEGEPSIDGEIGPLKGGLASLARRGNARQVLPVAISYDPLGFGRTRAYVSVAPALAPSPGTLTRAVTDALLRATPLTPGQLAASILVTAGDQAPALGMLEQAAEEHLARSRVEGRPIEPDLQGPGRGRALRVAFWQARRRGAHHPVIRRLAREFESANRIS